ncbi:MAG: hypothetical protein JNL01_01155 [Bdellovibrionales bacterium]|nr:hypothetical protein [Bdellovibrionales bacterium]
MRFKMQLIHSIAIVSLILSSACSIQVGEKETSQSAGQGMSNLCLNGLSDLIGRYFDGKASDPELQASWNCAIDALTKFQTQTRGAQLGQWKPTELREFLHRFFISDFKISDRLLDEAMVLKNSVIGGGTSELRASDLNQLVKILKVLRDETIRLRPFMPIPLKDISKRSDQQIQDLENALLQSANHLGDALNTKWNAYPFSNLKAFVEEISKIYKESNLEVLTSRMDLLIAMKRLLVSPIKVVRADGSLTEGLQGDELVRLFATLSRSLGLYLRYARLTDSMGAESVWMGVNLQRSMQLVRDAVAILLDSLQEYPFEVIPFSEIHALLKGIKDNEMGPFRRKTLERLVEPFVQRFMGGPDFGLGGRRATGLSASGLRRTKSVLENWYDVQTTLEKGYLEVLGKSLPTKVFLGTPVAPMELLHYFNQIDPLSAKGEAAAKISENLANDKAFPTFFMSDLSEITFFPYKSERRKTFYQMSMWNMFRTITTFLISGWADEQKRSDSAEKVTQAEFNNLVNDAVDTLIDLKLLDPAISPMSLASKRFREANLFTPAANGDGYFDFNEGMQYMALLVSGVNLASRIYGDLNQKCGLKEVDVYGRNWLDEKCVRATLFDPVQFEFYTQNMGLGPSYYLQLTGERSQIFRRALEASGRQDDGTGGKMNSYVGEGTATTLQYVEVMFSSFDRNRDGYIDDSDDEGGEAFKVFEGTLKGFAPTLSPKQVRSLFTYLLKNGRVPRTDECGKTTLGGKLNFVQWHIFSKQSFRADRVRVLEVFEEIARQVNKSSNSTSFHCGD